MLLALKFNWERNYFAYFVDFENCKIQHFWVIIGAKIQTLKKIQTSWKSFCGFPNDKMTYTVQQLKFVIWESGLKNELFF